MTTTIYDSDNVSIDLTFGTVWVFDREADKFVAFPREELPKVVAALNAYLKEESHG